MGFQTPMAAARGKVSCYPVAPAKHRPVVVVGWCWAHLSPPGPIDIFPGNLPRRFRHGYETLPWDACFRFSKILSADVEDSWRLCGIIIIKKTRLTRSNNCWWQVSCLLGFFDWLFFDCADSVMERRMERKRERSRGDFESRTPLAWQHRDFHYPPHHQSSFNDRYPGMSIHILI